MATGQGGGLTTAIRFAPVRAKFVRITQTAASNDGASWTVQRLRLYQAPGRPAPNMPVGQYAQTQPQPSLAFQLPGEVSVFRNVLYE